MAATTEELFNRLTLIEVKEKIVDSFENVNKR